MVANSRPLKPSRLEKGMTVQDEDGRRIYLLDDPRIINFRDVVAGVYEDGSGFVDLCFDDDYPEDSPKVFKVKE